MLNGKIVLARETSTSLGRTHIHFGPGVYFKVSFIVFNSIISDEGTRARARCNFSRCIETLHRGSRASR